MAEKKIGEHTYKTGVVRATDALKLKARLLKILGNGAKQLPVILRGRGDKATDVEKEKSDNAAVQGLQDIFEAVEPDEFVSIISDIVGLAQVHRPSGTWDQCDLDGQFTQHKGELYPVVLFVLQDVFGDFFTGLAGLGNQVKFPGQA